MPDPATRTIACKTCGQLHTMVPLRPGDEAMCTRCSAPLERRPHNSLARTAAFALAALLLYIPANAFPILRLQLYGSYTESTVWDGVVLFYRDGQWVMAIIVVLASIVIPVVKLLGLFFIVILTWLKVERGRMLRTRIYNFIDIIGKFAMLDVFVLAIWVALVKLERLASVTPAEGLLPFGGVVVLTLLASASFDPQLIWEGVTPHE